jgi:aminoglycoside phosphotransferase (APT) family kinase protein
VWGGTHANLGRPITAGTELVSHRDYYPGNVVFRDGLPVALIDFDLARPTTRLYDIANALWYWAPLRDPRDRPPAFADADIPHRVAGCARLPRRSALVSASQARPTAARAGSSSWCREWLSPHQWNPR